MRRRLRVLISALFILACGETPTSPSSPIDLSMRVVYRGVTSQTGAEQRMVIRDDATWQRVWSRLWIDPADAPAIEVDFTREMVVLSTRGGGACDETRIDRVYRDGSGLRVTVTDRIIDPNKCGCISVALNPVHIVATPREPASATFDVKTVVSCDRL